MRYGHEQPRRAELQGGGFVGLSDGTNALTASVTDTAGKTGVSTAVTCDVATQAPTVTVTSAASPTATSHDLGNGHLDAAGNAALVGAPVTLYENGQRGRSRHEQPRRAELQRGGFVGLSDGTNALTASVTDMAGQRARSRP